MPFTRCHALMVGIALVSFVLTASALDTVSGSVKVAKLGAIVVTHAAAYVVRDGRHARTTQTEILLSNVAIDAASVRTALDPHMVAINLAPLKDQNYVLLWVESTGAVTMNATFSKTMTQFMNDTTDGLEVTWKTRSATRLEGHLASKGVLKTMDGTTYTVDLTFAVDVVTPPAGQPLPAGGGEPGKALAAFLAAARKHDWPAIKAGSSPYSLEMFDRSYNTPDENASSAAELLDAWIPKTKMAITGGELSGDVARLTVEGEMFPGQLGLSIVQMVKTGTVWQFDRASRVGMVP